MGGILQVEPRQTTPDPCSTLIHTLFENPSVAFFGRFLKFLFWCSIYWVVGRSHLQQYHITDSIYLTLPFGSIGGEPFYRNQYMTNKKTTFFQNSTNYRVASIPALGFLPYFCSYKAKSSQCNIFFTLCHLYLTCEALVKKCRIDFLRVN